MTLQGWDPIYVDPGGGSGGGGGDEIGHGTALPADASEFELFEVDGSTDPGEVPDGLYRWINTTSAWVQVG